MNRLLIVGCCFFTLAAGTVTWAEKPTKGEGQHPPQEAIAACEGQDVGASVSFTTPRGDTLTASCESRNGQLVAVPEGHKGKGQRPPKHNGE